MISVQAATAPISPSTDIVVDAHVHLHDPGQDGAVLDTAAGNFAACCPVASKTGVLMLADMRGQDAFSRLLARASARSADGSWTATAEPTSLWYRAGDWRVLVVAGRQLVTAERLELLALGTRSRFEEGLPLDALLEHIEADDALPVLAWGCGKWLGERGSVVRHAIARARPGRLFLGDNGGRPTFWPAPIFATAVERHIAVLPGTDPLPLRSEWPRIGRFGFSCAARLSADTPAADLKRVLRGPDFVPRPFGALEHPLRFAWNQLRLRLGRRSAAAKHRT